MEKAPAPTTAAHRRQAEPPGDESVNAITDLDPRIPEKEGGRSGSCGRALWLPKYSSRAASWEPDRHHRSGRSKPGFRERDRMRSRHHSGGIHEQRASHQCRPLGGDRVGSVPRLARAEVPYPASDVITGIDWDFRSIRRLAPGSDNWPITWSDKRSSCSSTTARASGCATSACLRGALSAGPATAARCSKPTSCRCWCEMEIEGNVGPPPLSAPAAPILLE